MKHLISPEEAKREARFYNDNYPMLSKYDAYRAATYAANAKYAETVAPVLEKMREVLEESNREIREILENGTVGKISLTALYDANRAALTQLNELTK